MTVQNVNLLYSDVSASIHKTKKGFEAIENQISNVLGISFYQIPGRPEFASNLQGFLHDMNDVVSSNAITTSVRQLILNNVTRVELIDVVVVSVSSQSLVVELSYKYKQIPNTQTVTISKEG